MNQIEHYYYHHFPIALKYVKYHWLTLIIVIAIIITIAIDHYGTLKNQRIAAKYQSQLRSIIQSAFPKYDGKLIQQSGNIIKMYAMGRENCLFAIFAFAMIPRQQVLSFFLNPLFFRIKDELVIQIPIVNEHFIKITLAVVMKKQIRTINKKSYPDIKHLCKQYRPAVGQKLNVPDTHSILVEKVDHVKHILANEKQIELWKNQAKYIKLMYLSNHNKFSRYPLAVRMVVILSNETDKMIEWLIGFVDRMSKVKMTGGQKKQALKRREGLQITYD